MSVKNAAYTNSQITWLEEHYRAYSSYSSLADAFNARFGSNRTKESIKYQCQKYSLNVLHSLEEEREWVKTVMPSMPDYRTLLKEFRKMFGNMRKDETILAMYCDVRKELKEAGCDFLPNKRETYIADWTSGTRKGKVLYESVYDLNTQANLADAARIVRGAFPNLKQIKISKRRVAKARLS